MTMTGKGTSQGTSATLSPTMLEALRLAAGAAGLWAHRGFAGFYVPGAGTVPITRNTISALERRGLVVMEEQPADHEVVYAETVRERGWPADRVVVTDAGRHALADR